MQSSHVTKDQIRNQAYAIYLHRGGQHGHDRDDWLQAEDELMQVPVHQIATLPPAAARPRPDRQKIARRAGSDGNDTGSRMKTMVGLWIDHRQAVIALVSAAGEQMIEIRSHVEKQPGRLTGVRSTTPYESQQVPADDSRERQFTGQLHHYYDEVIAAIRGAESILIFGPGEAKGELKKRLEHVKLGAHIIAMETADKMTKGQIAAKVRASYSQIAPAG